MKPPFYNFLRIHVILFIYELSSDAFYCKNYIASYGEMINE
jgi:hypothetical protein